MTWRTGIAEVVQARCAGCHGAAAREYNDWNLGDKKDAPRMDTCPAFMSFVVWPATGAIMHRLDDGKRTADGKAGNGYAHLGDGAWNLNRWGARGKLPGVTKEQLDKIEAKY